MIVVIIESLSFVAIATARYFFFFLEFSLLVIAIVIPTSFHRIHNDNDGAVFDRIAINLISLAGTVTGDDYSI